MRGQCPPHRATVCGAIGLKTQQQDRVRKQEAVGFHCRVCEGRPFSRMRHNTVSGTDGHPSSEPRGHGTLTERDHHDNEVHSSVGYACHPLTRSSTDQHLPVRHHTAGRTSAGPLAGTGLASAGDPLRDEKEDSCPRGREWSLQGPWRTSKALKLLDGPTLCRSRWTVAPRHSAPGGTGSSGLRVTEANFRNLGGHGLQHILL